MEAWLKFRAPGVTLPVGLSIGKLVFTALNRMEWVFVLILMIAIAPHIRRFPAKFYFFTGAAVLLLMLQTFWLLPELSFRAEQIIAGNILPESKVHMLFGIAEIGKVAILLCLGYLAGKTYFFRK